MAITTIFFDVGGTLMYPDMESLMAPLLRHRRPTAEQMAAADRAAKYSAPPNGDNAPPKTVAMPTGPAGQKPSATSHTALHAAAAAQGVINRGHWYVYFETLLDSLGCCRELLPELTARAGDSSHWTLLAPGVAETLASLKPHYRLGVISNADGRIRQVLERGGLAQFFEQITDSGLVGYEKPDSRIFHAALQAMGVMPGESLYVGDIYPIDYEGATAAGMQALLVDPDGVYAGQPAPRITALRELETWLKSRSDASQ